VACMLHSGSEVIAMPNFLPARIDLKFRRSSHRDVFEHMEEWANSHGLRPPNDEARAGGFASDRTRRRDPSPASSRAPRGAGDKDGCIR
jgi:hypothetical protein